MNSSKNNLSPRGRILVVDDEPSALDILSRLLQPYYEVMVAPSGERALAICARPRKPDLILLDVVMPGMDGFTVLARLRENASTQAIPVIFVTGMNATEDEERGLELGAADYIVKPFRLPIIRARVHAQLELKRARDWMRNQNSLLEAEVERRMRDIVTIQDITINVLAELAEMRDPETGNHIRRTQEYVHILAGRLLTHPRFSGFLTDRAIELLVKSAPLHDIGKVGIPDHILLKPGPLTDEEWTIMKTHSQLGAMAIDHGLRHVEHGIDFLDMAKEIAHFHHEKWDGSGYPEGRRGDDIPISARLMALADVFDALVSRRVYKEALPVEQAREIIAAARGSHFDPDVVDAFLSGFSEFVVVARRYDEGE